MCGQLSCARARVRAHAHAHAHAQITVRLAAPDQGGKASPWGLDHFEIYDASQGPDCATYFLPADVITGG